MRCSLQVLWTQKLADVRSFGFRGAIRRIFLFFANEKTRKTTLFVACVEHVQTVLAQDHCSSDILSSMLLSVFAHALQGLLQVHRRHDHGLP